MAPPQKPSQRGGRRSARAAVKLAGPAMNQTIPVSDTNPAVNRPRITACEQCLRGISKNPELVCNRTGKKRNCARCTRKKVTCAPVDRFHSRQVTQLLELQEDLLLIPADDVDERRRSEARVRRAATSLGLRMTARKNAKRTESKDRELAALESIADSLKALVSLGRIHIGLRDPGYESEVSEGSVLSEEEYDGDGVELNSEVGDQDAASQNTNAQAE